MRNHKLLGLLIGGTMFGMLATSSLARAQLIPDTYFRQLSSSSVSISNGRTSSTLTISGTFTGYIPLVEGVSCTSSDAESNNFLASNSAPFFISVGPGLTTGGNCISPSNTGVGFTFVWKKSTSSRAVPAGTASWVDSNGNSGTSAVTGSVTLIGGSPTSTLGNDCGTWMLSISFPGLSTTDLSDLGLTNNTTVNVQMDYGTTNPSDPSEGVNFSSACMVLPLSVSS